MNEQKTVSPEEPIPYSSLSDDALGALWERDNDVCARDILYLRHWRDGDKNKGIELVSLYNKYFYRVCYQYGLEREDDMLEIYQDVMVDLLEQLENLPEKVRTSFAGYLGWRTRKAIQNFYRKRSPMSLPTDVQITQLVSTRLEDWEIIEKCWDRLPRVEHQVFELRYVQEMNLKEVASVMGSNVSAVGNSIYRLSHRMRDCLEKISA